MFDQGAGAVELISYVGLRSNALGMISEDLVTSGDSLTIMLTLVIYSVKWASN